MEIKLGVIIAHHRLIFRVGPHSPQNRNIVTQLVSCVTELHEFDGCRVVGIRRRCDASPAMETSRNDVILKVGVINFFKVSFICTWPKLWPGGQNMKFRPMRL